MRFGCPWLIQPVFLLGQLYYILWMSPSRVAQLNASFIFPIDRLQQHDVRKLGFWHQHRAAEEFWAICFRWVKQKRFPHSPAGDAEPSVQADVLTPQLGMWTVSVGRPCSDMLMCANVRRNLWPMSQVACLLRASVVMIFWNTLKSHLPAEPTPGWCCKHCYLVGQRVYLMPLNQRQFNNQLENKKNKAFGFASNW